MPTRSLYSLRLPRFTAATLLYLTVFALAQATIARSQEVSYPLAVAVSPSNEVFVADRNLPGVWKFVDNKPTIYFQASKKFRTPLNAIRCLAFDNNGKLLAGDSSTRDVYRFDDAGQPQPLTKGHIGIPMAIAVASSGELFVADLEIPCIWKVPAAGGEPKRFAEVRAPRGLAMDKNGWLWVVSHGNDQVLRVAPDGNIETAVTGRPFNFPHHIIVKDADTAFIVDGYEKGVWKVVLGKEPEKVVFGAPLDGPVGIAWRGEEKLVIDPRANALFSLDEAGKLTTLWKHVAPAGPPTAETAK